MSVESEISEVLANHLKEFVDDELDWCKRAVDILDGRLEGLNMRIEELEAEGEGPGV